MCMCVYTCSLSIFTLSLCHKGKKQNYILLVLARYGNITTKGTLPNTSSEPFGSFFSTSLDYVVPNTAHTAQTITPFQN